MSTAGEVIYICIRTHGTVIPNAEDREKGVLASEIISYLQVDPAELIVNKFNIACPGKTGFNLSPECVEASRLLGMYRTRKSPGVTSEEMTDSLLQVYEESIPTRHVNDTANIKEVQKANLENHTSEAISRDVVCSRLGPTIETNETDFTNKMFLSDLDSSVGLCSIDVLNGPHKGENIIDRKFFIENELASLDISHKYYQNYLDGRVWGTILDKTDGEPKEPGEPREPALDKAGDICQVLNQISLFELFVLLKYLGMTNVYIIDPSCAVNYRGWELGNKRVDRLMTDQCSKYVWPEKNPESTIEPVIFPMFRRNKNRSVKDSRGGKTRKNKRKKYCNKTKRHYKKYKKNKTKRRYKIKLSN